jgi:transposase, IS6 family
MERSHPSSGRSATPADIIRNGRPTSIGTGGRHQSECPADIIGIRMLWLRKGFGFAGAWTVCEQNQLLSVCFGLLKANEA